MLPAQHFTPPAAQALVPPTLRVARVLPGRTLCSIGAIEYKDGDLGRYHEISITFFVHERGARTVPFLDPAVGLMRGEEVGMRLGGADLTLGTHPIGDELRSLGLPKRALFSTFMTKMSGTFYAAERV